MKVEVESECGFDGGNHCRNQCTIKLVH
jgi:hypothetical protein